MSYKNIYQWYLVEKGEEVVHAWQQTTVKYILIPISKYGPDTVKYNVNINKTVKPNQQNDHLLFSKIFIVIVIALTTKRLKEMFNTLTTSAFSIKSFALNPNRIKFRLIHTWYTQQRKGDQGHHNRLQQVFYNESKSKQLLKLSTSAILIRTTPIQHFGTSTSFQSSAKRKMVN